MDRKGQVEDVTRLQESLPTIQYLLAKKNKVVLLSHLGRPNGKKNPKFSLKPVAQKLSKILRKKVHMAPDCAGNEVEKLIKKTQNKDLVLLENTRFHPEDEENDPSFSRKLAKLADAFVFDAFGTAHRNHASVTGIAKLLPSYAGILVEREIKALSKILKKPKKPVVVVIGGAKIETKLPLFKSFLNKANTILVGGAIANTFLAAAGYNIGKSLYEKENFSLAQEIMLEAEKHKVKFVLPKDVVVATHLSPTVQTLNLPIEDIEGDMKIFDIGKWTIEHFDNHLHRAGTVIWNGPMGVFECEPFSKGTHAIIQSLSNCKKCYTVVGGGDTLDALRKFKIAHEKFEHVSTGGGAMLKFLSGEKLPALEALS